MIDTNLLQNTQEKYICGQYDNKLACIVIGLRLMYTQFDQIERMNPKHMSVNRNLTLLNHQLQLLVDNQTH